VRTRHLWPMSLAAGLTLAACQKTPDPPGSCSFTLKLPDIELFGKRLLRLAVPRDLDALRTQILATKDQRQVHLVQEYLMAANQLPRDKRDAALAAIRRSLVPRRALR